MRIHLRKEKYSVCCGAYVSYGLVTSSVNEVTCENCKRTKSYLKRKVSPLQQRDTDFIKKFRDLHRTYRDITCNTNSLFRARLSESLAEELPFGIDMDFLRFICDAEVIARLKMVSIHPTINKKG